MLNSSDTEIAPVPAPHRKANILLVDDHPTNLLTLRAILEDLNQNLVEASSGEEALARLQDEEFAVVLMDIQMPGLDGFETAKLIRAQNSKRTPIIFLTAYDSDEFPIDKAYSLGAVDYLVKPLRPVIVRAKVTAFVDLYEKTEQIRRQAEQLRIAERKVAADKIRESEQDLSDFFDNASVGLHLVGPDGIILRANRAELNLLGYQQEEYVGRPISDFHADAEVICDILNRLQAGQNVNEYPARLRCKDGTFKEVLIASSAKFEDGKFVHTRCFTRDVTEQNRAHMALRESEARWRVMTEALPNLVWTDLPDGQCDWLSVQWEKYTGIPVQELLGTQWLEKVIHPDDRERTLECWRAACEDRGDYDIEYRIRRHDGKYHWFKTRGVPLRDEQGKISYWFGSCTDIEDSKQLEAALLEADRRKDEFLATLAHELRNPLAPLRNSLHILRMPSVDAETIQRSHEMMERQLQHLVRLVDDLLDVSRVMRGKIELRKESVELVGLVARCVESVNPFMEASSHQLIFSVPSEPLMLDADPVRLSQIVVNLLNNAAKYTDAKGRIGVSVQRIDDRAVISVRDNGIGIAAEMLPKIFDLFVQVECAGNRSQGGLGLGLTLVKNLVEMHGGSIEARSEGLGKGSEFVVSLPLSPAHTHHDSDTLRDERNTDTSTSGHRLLVVDDNRDAALSLALLLRLQGHDVQVSHDGFGALELVKLHRPHAVFLDIGMPGLDGYEVARRIREIPGMDAAVLAALTGFGQQEDRRRSTQAGFDYHLVKPPETKDIDKVLAGLRPQPASTASQRTGKMQS